MQKKYASQGLVIITVATDDIRENPKSKDEALKLLRADGVTATNLLLDEPIEFWSEKLHYVTPPCIFIFNRQGKWRQYTNESETQVVKEVMEKQVVEFLKSP